MLKKSFFLALALSIASFFILSLPGCGGGDGTSTIASSTAKAMTSFSFAGAAGVIDEPAKTIAVTVPSGTDVTGLVATFTSTGVNVKVGSTLQTSAATANDFSSPVSYTVTAADTTTATYIVTVIVSIPSYYVDPVNGLNTNTGTQAFPFKTITWAINAASAVAAINGADIHAASGVYSTAETFPLMPTTGEHLIGPVIGSGTANIDGAGLYNISGGELPLAIAANKQNPIFTTIAFAPGVTGSVSGITVNDGSYPSVFIPNVIFVDKATVTLSDNTFTFDKTNPYYYPVWIVNGSVATLTSNTITGYVSVDVADGSTKVLARNNHFEGSYGVVTADSGLTTASQLDLGTAASPGNNTILSTIIGVSSWSLQPGDPGVTAVGNNWTPNVQCADGNGHCAAGLFTGPTSSGPSSGQNYYVVPPAGIQF